MHVWQDLTKLSFKSLLDKKRLLRVQIVGSTYEGNVPLITRFIKNKSAECTFNHFVFVYFLSYVVSLEPLPIARYNRSH